MTDFIFSRDSMKPRIRESFRAFGSLSVATSLLLTGCSLPLMKHGEVNKKINRELANAEAKRNSANAPIDAALMPPLQVEEPRLKNDADKRFDLSVVGAPAQQVFMALVTGTRYNMLLPPDLSGNISVKLKDVTIKEALDTIRELYGYEYRVEGNRIFIQTNTLQSRVFQINYLAGRRQGTSNLRVASSSLSPSGTGATGGSTSTGVATPAAPAAPASPAGSSTTGGMGSAADASRVNTTSDADFWRDLGTALKSIVGDAEGRNVIVNPMSGVVVVRALPNEIRNVNNYLKATQLVVERQVMLEAKIVAVTLSNGSQSGINWSVFNSFSNARTMGGVLSPNANLTTTGNIQSNGTNLTVTPGKYGSAVADALGGGFVGLAFQTANFSALLNFLETQGDVSVLSSPRIATLNNQKALLKVGTDDMFVVNVSGGTASTSSVQGTAPTLTLQPFFSGISLDVTPQIDDEGNIILHVHPAVSQVSEVQKVVDLGTNGGIFKLPLPSSEINETDSIVRVQNGNIVAIGGLMKQQQTSARSQLPGLGESRLGLLFGQRNASVSKTEMVILIKPTIIGGDKDWQPDLHNVRVNMWNYDPDNRKPAATAK